MKVLALLALFIPSLLNATIVRVNNNPVYDPDYIDLQLAVDAASDHDTIHVEPSGASYGTVICDKVLVFIGPGFNLSLPNGNPDLQANPIMATLRSLKLEANASGSVVQGLHFDGGTLSGMIVNCVSASIVGNLFEGNLGSIKFDTGTFYSGVLIKGNYFNPSTSNNEAINENVNTTQVFADVLITNNIFHGDIVFDDQDDSIGNMVIAHNVLAGTQYKVEGAEFVDNIFTEPAVSLTLNLNTIHHNIAASTILPPGNGNDNTVDMSTIFSASASDDARWALQPGVAGTYPAADGTERGIFGGNMPYTLSGIPSVPSIYHLQQSGSSVLQGGTLEVTIGTRSND